MIIKKKRSKVVELFALNRGDVFEYKDDIYMLLEDDYVSCPRERKCVDLSNGRVFILVINTPVIPLKAELSVEFDNKERKNNE